MALSLAACGGSSTTTTTPVVETPVVDTPVVVAPTAQTFALTSAANEFTGGDGADTFAATHLTLNATDELVGGAGEDTLTITNTGSAAFTAPSADISGIENIEVRNITGTSNGSAEVATVTVGGLQAGQTLTVAGQTIVATADLTAANIADILTGGTVSGGTISGTLDTGYTKAAGTNADEVVYTATTNGDKADLAATGTAQSDIKQVSILEVATAGLDGTEINQKLLINGTTVTGGTIAKDSTAAVQAANYAEIINSYLGSNVATVAGGTVQIISDTALNIGLLEPVDEAGNAMTTTAQVATYVLAPSKATYKVTGVSNAKTSTFTMNGEEVTVGVTDADATATEAAVLLAAAINTQFGSTIATASTDTVTVDSGDIGLAITGFSSGANSGINGMTITPVTTSAGLLATDATVISTVDGAAAVSGYGSTYDMATFKDATQFIVDRSTADVTVSNMTAAQELTIKGNGALTNGDTAATFKATVTDVTLNIQDGVKAGDVTVTAAGATSATVTSTGDKNTVGTVDIGAGTLKTLTIDAATNLKGDLASQATDQIATDGKLIVTGAASSVNLTEALDDTIKTIDASGLTGGLTASVGSGTQDISGGAGADSVTLNTGVKTADFGAGDDTVTTAAVAATAAGAVKGGSGSDTLSIAATSDVDTIAKGAVFTGFEVVSTAVDVDLGNLSTISAVEVTENTGISLTDMNAATAANITVKENVTNDLTVVLTDATGTADVVSIDASFDDGSATTTDDATKNVSIAGIKVAGVETLNLTAGTGTAGTDSTFTFGGSGADKLTSLNVDGSADVDLTTTNIAKAVSIDASDLTGAMTLAGDLTTGSSVTTGAGKDVVTSTTTTGTSYSLGAGKDSFTAAKADLAATGSDDTSVDGGADVDTLTISDDGSTLTDAYFTGVSNFEKLTYADGGTISLTTGAAFSSAFGDAVTITVGEYDDGAAFTYAGGLYNGDTTLSLTTAGVGNTKTEDITVTTGDGDDIVTIVADDWIGVAGETAQIVVSTDEGDDTITISDFALAANTTVQAFVITGGKGKDTIDLDGDRGTGATASAEYVINAGDSNVDSYDVIKNFFAAGTDYNDKINFEGSAAVTDFSNSTDAGVIASHSVSSGIVSFDDAANYATKLVIDEGNLDDVLSYLATNTDTNDTAAFLFDSNGDGSDDSTMVFHNYTTDSLVLLQDSTNLDSLVGSADKDAGDVFIA